MTDKDSIWKNTNEAANFIKLKCESLASFKPVFGILCGAGLSNIAEILDGDDETEKGERIVIPYQDIPYFYSSKVEGQINKIIIGSINKAQVICFQGKVYMYEDTPLWKVALPIRIMKLLNVETIFIADTAVPLSEDYRSGDIMIVRDHIDLISSFCDNPLAGQDDERWGLQSVDMKFAYDPELRYLAKLSTKNLKLEKYVKQGVYIMVRGPNFLTFAEESFYAEMGANVIGFGITNDVLVARQCRLAVCAFSFITADYLDPIKAYADVERKVERADSHVVDSENILTTVRSLEKFQDEKFASLSTGRRLSNIDPESMLALSVDDGSRRIGQIIKEIVIRKILS